MSQSSNLSSNTGANSGAAVEKQEKNICMIDRTPKRGASEVNDDRVKKIKVEHASSDQNASKVVPQFMPASQIPAHQTRATVEVVPEISDDELLAMAMEFEKKHPEYN